MNKNRLILSIAICLLLLPSVLGLEIGGLDNVLGEVGKQISDLVQDSWFRFGITFILVFMIMYGIYSAGLNKVSAFKGKGDQPNKPGKLIAGSLGLITALGLSYYSSFSAAEFTERVLETAGWLGAVALGFLVFGLGYYNMRDEQGESRTGMVLFTVGLGLVTYGTIIDEKKMSGLGMGFIIFGIILMIIRSSGRSAGDMINRAIDTASRLRGDRRPGRPSRVTGFNAVHEPATGAVTLNWNPNPAEDNVISYNITRYRRRTGRFRKWSAEGTLSSSGTSVVDNRPIDTSQSYKYVIRARNAKGLGPKEETPLNLNTGFVTGKIIFDDGQEHPLQDIEISLSGPGNFGPILTNANGEFRIDKVPNSGAYNLHVKDPQGVYQDIDFNNLIDIKGHNSIDIKELRLQIKTTKKVGIEVDIIDDTGASLPGPFDIYAVGGFGNELNSGVTPTGGVFEIDAPAGYAVNVIVHDPSGAFKNGSTNNNILLRLEKAYIPQSNPHSSPTPPVLSDPPYKLKQITMKPYGTDHKIEGYCYYKSSGNNNLEGITVTVRNPISKEKFSGDPSGTQTNPNNNYKVDGISSYPLYEISATDPTNQFRPLKTPLRKNFPIITDQTVHVRMIPNSPKPTGTIEVLSSGGTVKATINF